MIYNKNYNNIIKMMIEKKLSIREMAKIIGIPKSTLHVRLQKMKYNITEEEQENFNNLLINNKKNMAQKGGITKSIKFKEGKIKKKQNEQIIKIGKNNKAYIGTISKSKSR